MRTQSLIPCNNFAGAVEQLWLLDRCHEPSQSKRWISPQATAKGSRNGFMTLICLRYFPTPFSYFGLLEKKKTNQSY